jgi:hypothetical protein
MTYLVEVTREDIQKGKPESGNMCPIARAVRRVVGRKAIYVLPGGGIRINYNQLWRADKHDMVRNFIENFDENETRRYCRPFSFYLTLK